MPSVMFRCRYDFCAEQRSHQAPVADWDGDLVGGSSSCWNGTDQRLCGPLFVAGDPRWPRPMAKCQHGSSDLGQDWSVGTAYCVRCCCTCQIGRRQTRRVLRHCHWQPHRSVDQSLPLHCSLLVYMLHFTSALSMITRLCSVEAITECSRNKKSKAKVGISWGLIRHWQEWTVVYCFPLQSLRVFVSNITCCC